MLKNKNRLIQPSHFSKEQSTNKNDSLYRRAYLNALQYYMDDPTCDYDNISFPAMYLYSLGDKNIMESPKVKRDEFGDKKIPDPSPQVKKQVEFYSKNLVSALQFRLQDRKYVLDMNTYNYNDLEDFLDVDVNLNVDNKHPLFNLFMRNFSLKYFKDLDAKDNESDTLLEKLKESKVTIFDGVFDEKDFQERYAKENNNRQILELDGYFKSELKEWKEKEDKKSLVDTNGIDLYPYVNGILYDNNKYFIAIALTERDENYIDDKTEEINKVFECSMFIYKNENDTIKSEQLSDFNENLKDYLGRFVNKCSLYKLQEAMNGAIGEAADISRYWYSKGLDSIFNTETEKEFENSEDSIEFYTKFVKELLCKIDGVKNTEIYPFDRVYLFPETGLDDEFRGLANMRVLEAKVKSRDPKDRGSYLMGWEQDVIDKDGDKVLDEANDLIFSDKQINYMDWNIANSDVFVKTITTVNKKHTRGNLLLSNLLLEGEFLKKTIDDEKGGANNKKLLNMKRKIRDEFNEYGLYYEYDFGLNLEEQFPELFKLQNKYLDEMAKVDKGGKYIKSDGVEYNEKDYHFNLKGDDLEYREVSKKELIQNMKKNIKENYKAKTITICFDPERITKPELAKAAEHLKRKDAITMVFVADKDFVKTTSELEAEIKDFEVLIQMIIRQVIYNTESAAKEIEIKKDVFSTASQALHDAKTFVKDKKIKEKIDNLMIQVSEELNTADSSSRETFVFESTNVYNDVLNKFFKGETALSNSSDLESKIREWLPNNHNISNISITLHESFLPKMKMLWNDLAISTSFKVLLKNATEYCGIYSQTSNDASLTLSMSIETLDNFDFLVVNIINTTPPLTKSRFDMLNNEEIDSLGKDSKKEGSTGVGVVSARRQIKSISSFNNITFTMLSRNVISAKMYLKVELLNDNNLFSNEDSEVDSEQEEMSSCDVIYFEDSREYYDENIPLLKKYNVSVAHSVRKDESYMSDAKLLLTDMSILNSNNKADEEEGLDGILRFKELNTKNAPICVLSNGEAGTIQSQILEHLGDMISPDDVLIVRDFRATLEDGKIFILNNVKTLDHTHSIVFDYLNSIGSNEIKDDKVKEQENYDLVQFTNNGDYTPEFDKLFSNLEHDISQKYFYIAQSSHTEVELTDILNKWLAFKTVRANKGDRKFAISNVTYHKNTLLIIDDIVLEDQREKWWLFYLGVKHNIIFNFLAKEHSDIVAQWSDVAVKRESSGYLGKLRHDVKNYQKIYEKNLKNTKLDIEFENIINATLELQKLLQLKKYESLQNFTQDSDIETRIDKLKILKYADEVEKRTNELRSSLKSAIEIMGNHTKDKTNISNLRSFKELIDFNVEFCTKNQKVSA